MTDDDRTPPALRLQPILDLTAARGLHALLAARLAAGALDLDAGAVERLSTPCAQVLLAAARAAERAGAAPRIRAASPEFRAALVDLGLDAAFSPWMT